MKLNFAAVDAAVDALHEVAVPADLNGAALPPIVRPDAPAFVREVTAEIMAGRGDLHSREPHAGGRHVPRRHDAI